MTCAVGYQPHLGFRRLPYRGGSTLELSHIETGKPRAYSLLPSIADGEMHQTSSNSQNCTSLCVTACVTTCVTICVTTCFTTCFTNFPDIEDSPGCHRAWLIWSQWVLSILWGIPSLEPDLCHSWVPDAELHAFAFVVPGRAPKLVMICGKSM